MQEYEFQSKAKEEAERELLDPGSVEYRNSRVIWRGRELSFCTDVNARNSYGGYTGFKRLIVSGRVNGNTASVSSVKFEGDRMVKDFSKTWAAQCISPSWPA